MDGIESILTLSYLPQLGPARIKQLHSAFGSCADVLERDPQVLAGYMPEVALTELGHWHRNPDHPIREQVKRDSDALHRQESTILTFLGHEHYPELLYNISAPPPFLTIRGSITTLELPQIAMVGTRRPTAGGRDVARSFARYLAGAGFAITSGLALGVDACAHRGALEAKGVTLAVLGTGLDTIYPARNRALADEIEAAGGTLISEFLPGTAPEAKNFPRRNRVISGLSLGTMVVEAAVKSGSLITARYALEQEREVFAVPGSIHNPMSRGCHALIKDGAKLVETADDIIDELGAAIAYKKQQCSQPQEKAPEQHWLLPFMGYDPVSVDSLCERSGANTSEITPALLELELDGLIEQRGCHYCRIC
ncbi:DNA-processing protein DprA [Gilvimarinus agarilyticus]|uniref:DNA-processing protein DprA n=1 Tax=unclassified Gilvimarinus TaxID=2642066 RepID=UPI001C0A590E|nr:MULTISPECIES: DNA-processing protein DprA [unclassified Gilvimarinus]MBU2884245.1 DNA-processing protein DprA [Gilvimarinus agarilyticus]MDO6569384.1 DNA-processing protein DprA [Gilvimarinus sp. 2_MG-2023]MDO6747538.1 DNA-processing protein DprA [Gilvimarinus sp. 1_MG-2023]